MRMISDAVADRALDELFHHVVRIVLVAQNVLAAQQHLQLGIRQGLAQLAQALPRILVQEAQQVSNVAPPQHSSA